MSDNDAASTFKAWLDAAFHGSPDDARKHCEATMSPDYRRWMAGADFTDLEKAVEKVALFRTICKKWETEVKLFIQEGNRVAARILCNFDFGKGDTTQELMLMAEKDDEGRYWRVWELSQNYLQGAES